MRKSGYLFIALVLVWALLLSGAAYADEGVDYADKDNWIWLTEQGDAEADLFFVAPTVYSGGEGSFNMPMDDAELRAKLLGAANMERGIYEQSCRLYAPCYRQVSLSAYTLGGEQLEEALSIAYEDVRSAFLYYMDNYNDDRPVVLAGFSQGADMVLRLLKEFYGEEDYQEKLIAAYVIGGAVTKAELDACPHLKMAECAGDLGCIVSFNSEAEDVKTSYVVPETTIGINPLNWKTDSTPAEASANLGACFTDYDGNITEEIPQLCGAYLDPQRGTLKVTGVTSEDYPPQLDVFTDGVYHVYDYQFFYRNLQKNVSLRVEQYLTMAFLRENYETEDGPEKPAASAPPYLTLAPNVSADMLSEQYWIEKIDEPDRVFMTAEEIEAFNAKNDWDYYLYSAADSPRTLSAQELKSQLMAGSLGEGYYHNGEKTTEAYWAALVDNCNVAGVKGENALSYGICVQRANLRILPTDDVISSTEKFTFYDELQNSTTLCNEPVIVLHRSADGQWLYVYTRYCAGWVRTEAVALCASYAEWEKAQSFKDFLVVTEDKLVTERDPVDPHSSEIELSMGVRLELAPAAEFKSSAEGRVGADCYVVKLPYRADDGSYAVTYAYMPVSRGVHVGYLELTPANILTLAFNTSGCRYGWGGMYNARDCSQLAMELYRCFGLVLARNSEDQAVMRCRTVKLGGMSDETKSEFLSALPAGSILHFPGHIMLYLGQEGGRSYVLSAAGSMCPSGSVTKEVLTYESVMVNDLSATRRSGHSWLEDMCCAKIFWEKAA